MKEAKELIRMATEISSAAKEEFSASGAVDLNLTVRIWFDEEPGGNLIRRIKATTEKALKRLDRIEDFGFSSAGLIKGWSVGKGFIYRTFVFEGLARDEEVSSAVAEIWKRG